MIPYIHIPMVFPHYSMVWGNNEKSPLIFPHYSNGISPLFNGMGK
jgi:hypothetical protein